MKLVSYFVKQTRGYDPIHILIGYNQFSIFRKTLFKTSYENISFSSEEHAKLYAEELNLKFEKLSMFEKFKLVLIDLF